MSVGDALFSSAHTDSSGGCEAWRRWNPMLSKQRSVAYDGTDNANMGSDATPQ
jgi:hypothetical protein